MGDEVYKSGKHTQVKLIYQANHITQIHTSMMLILGSKYKNSENMLDLYVVKTGKTSNYRLEHLGNSLPCLAHTSCFDQ